MFRPYIKRTHILVLVAMINLLLVYVSYQSYSFTKSKDYELKIEAAREAWRKLIAQGWRKTNVIW